MKVPFYNLAVTCKREGIVEFLKPLVNFAMLPTDNLGDSVSILYLPSVHHKLFMKTMGRTKKFMQEKEFLFAKIMTMVRPCCLRSHSRRLPEHAPTSSRSAAPTWRV